MPEEEAGHELGGALQLRWGRSYRVFELAFFVVMLLVSLVVLSGTGVDLFNGEGWEAFDRGEKTAPRPKTEDQ